MNDLADRPPRALADGETLTLLRALAGRLAATAGTTALYQYLVEHPGLFLTEPTPRANTAVNVSVVACRVHAQR